MKTVKFFNKNLQGVKTTLEGTFENITNDSDLASNMFFVIGMANMPEDIDFENIFNNNLTFETQYFIMEFVTK